MIKLSCYDKKGDAIDYLFQWDTNIALVLKGLSSQVASNLRVHFANQRSVEAAVVVPTESEEGLMAVIPNTMFVVPDVLFVYIYATDQTDNEGRTIAELRIPIRPRHKPSNYEENGNDDGGAKYRIVYASDAMAKSNGGVSRAIIAVATEEE